jgi:hypothetical protein
MKFAMIGSNPAALPLLRELVQDRNHSVTAAVLHGELLNQVSVSGLPIQTVSQAEDLLTGSGVEVLVIAIEDPDEILRLARAACQADQHVVVVPPALKSSPALSFELHLVFDESQTSIIPLLGRWYLTDLSVGDHSLNLNPGEVIQLRLELELPAADEASLKNGVRFGLDVLAACGFRYSQVTCIDSQSPNSGLLSRLITLSAQPAAEAALPPATLTIRPSSKDSEQTGSSSILHIMLANGQTRQVSVGPVPMIPRLLSLCQNRAACNSAMDAFSTTLELCEAVEKSIRRRRTVDVHFETGSEKSVFKSQMTAIGCGVLTWLLIGMIAYLIAGALLDLPNWVWHTLRILWFAPLMLFIVAQFLLPLARERGQRPPEP